MKEFHLFFFFLSLFSFFLLSQAATSAETQALIDLYNATNGPQWYPSVTGYTSSSGDPCVNKWTGIACTNTTSSGSVIQLGLNNNQLSGTIPSSFGNLINLKYLYLYSNQLSGTIPSSFGNLINLFFLDLEGNQLSGTIPSSFGNLINLNYFVLQNNYLTGTLPSTQPASYPFFSGNYFCNEPSWCTASYCSSPTNPFYELYSPVNAVSVNVSSLPYSPTLSDLQIQVFGCDSSFTNYVVFNPSSISSGGNTSVTVNLSYPGSNSGYPLQSVVVIVNVIPPVIITCSPTPVNVSLSSSGTYTLVPSSLATAISTIGSSLTFSANLSSLSCSNLGTNYILVTATDSQGHSASCSTTVNVNPFISISCVSSTTNLILSSGGVTSAYSTSNLISSTINPCSVSLTYSPSSVSFTCSQFGSNSVSFSVSDPFGNTVGSCQSPISVGFSQPPSLNCISSTSISLNSNGKASITPSSLINSSNDICLSSSPSYSSNVTSFGCSQIGSNPVLISTTDLSGNTINCSSIVNLINPSASFSCLQGVVIGLNSPSSTTTVSSSQVSSISGGCPVSVNISPSTVSINNLSSSPINFTVTSSTNSSLTCTSTGYVVINGILKIGSAVKAVGTSFIIKWQTSFTSLFSSSSKVTLYYFNQYGIKQIINSSPINYSVGQFIWHQGFPGSLKVNEYYSIFMSINGQIVGADQVYVIL